MAQANARHSIFDQKATSRGKPTPATDPIIARITAYKVANVAFNTAIGGNAEERLSSKAFAKLEQASSDRNSAALNRLLKSPPVTLAGLKAALDFIVSKHVTARSLREEHEAINAFVTSLATGFATIWGVGMADPIFDGIRRHEFAWQRVSAVISEPENAARETVERVAYDVLDAAEASLFRMRPETIKGATALLDYAVNSPIFEAAFDDGPGVGSVLRHILETINGEAR